MPLCLWRGRYTATGINTVEIVKALGEPGALILLEISDMGKKMLQDAIHKLMFSPRIIS